LLKVWAPWVWRRNGFWIEPRNLRLDSDFLCGVCRGVGSFRELGWVFWGVMISWDACCLNCSGTNDLILVCLPGFFFRATGLRMAGIDWDLARPDLWLESAEVLCRSLLSFRFIICLTLKKAGTGSALVVVLDRNWSMLIVFFISNEFQMLPAN
jgi:hypothetical protein